VSQVQGELAVDTPRILGVRRGITSGWQATPVTLGYPEVGHQFRELLYLRAALRKASHATISASATSVVTTVSARVTRT
jgi:hypothetical protein